MSESYETGWRALCDGYFIKEIAKLKNFGMKPFHCAKKNSSDFFSVMSCHGRHDMWSRAQGLNIRIL